MRRSCARCCPGCAPCWRTLRAIKSRMVRCVSCLGGTLPIGWTRGRAAFRLRMLTAARRRSSICNWHWPMDGRPILRRRSETPVSPRSIGRRRPRSIGRFGQPTGIRPKGCLPTNPRRRLIPSTQTHSPFFQERCRKRINGLFSKRFSRMTKSPGRRFISGRTRMPL